MLTPEQLQEILERAEKATPGPWKWDDTLLKAPKIRGQNQFVMWMSNSICSNAESDAQLLGALGNRAERDATANKEFIAAVRTDIPALLAHAEEQRAEIERLRAENTSLLQRIRLNCSHDRLDEDGQCRLCGADVRRGC